jgi:hypothetical protein
MKHAELSSIDQGGGKRRGITLRGLLACRICGEFRCRR